MITEVRVCDSKVLRVICTGICEGERDSESNHIMWNFRPILFTKYYKVQEIKENEVGGSHIICGDGKCSFSFKTLLEIDHLGEMGLNVRKASASYEKLEFYLLVVGFSRSTALHGVSWI